MSEGPSPIFASGELHHEGNTTQQPCPACLQAVSQREFEILKNAISDWYPIKFFLLKTALYATFFEQKYQINNWRKGSNLHHKGSNFPKNVLIDLNFQVELLIMRLFSTYSMRGF
jgi:hypothetical protein